MVNQLNMGKIFLKIRFESDDDLPLDKILNIPLCLIAVGSVFKTDNKYYQQVHLHGCLYEFENELKRVYNFCTIYIALL